MNLTPMTPDNIRRINTQHRIEEIERLTKRVAELESGLKDNEVTIGILTKELTEDTSLIDTLIKQRDYWKDKAETLQNLQNFGI